MCYSCRHCLRHGCLIFCSVYTCQSVRCTVCLKCKSETAHILADCVCRAEKCNYIIRILIILIKYLKAESLIFFYEILELCSICELIKFYCYKLVLASYLDCRKCLCLVTVCDFFRADCGTVALTYAVNRKLKIAVFIYNLAVYDVDIGIESLGCFGCLGCIRCIGRFGSTADLFTSSCTCACAVFAGIITCCEKILCDCIRLSYLLGCKCIVINLCIYHCHALSLEVATDKSFCYVVTKAEIVVSAAYAGDKISCNAYFSVLFAVDINCAFLISCIIYTDYMNKLCYR